MARRKKNRLKFEELRVFPTADRFWRRACLSNLHSLLPRDEAFSAAFNIRDDDGLVRYELESRILTGQTDAEIAGKMQIPEDVVGEYSFWFFDVRDRLHLTTWIAREAIRRDPSGKLEQHDIGPLWRWIAFNYGPLALEEVLAAVDPQTLQSQGIDAYCSRNARLDPSLKFLIFIERLHGLESPRKLVRLHRLQELLAITADFENEDCLGPLTMQMLPFAEPEIANPVPDVEQIPESELLGGFVIVPAFDLRLTPQTQAL